MLEAIIRSLRISKRGISTVIVVMLSLVLVVIVVTNVVLWSFQMNQYDWERMQEKIALTNATHVTRSPWFTSQSEYTTNIGNRMNGTYTYTQTVDGNYETFREESAPSNESFALDIAGVFILDLSNYPMVYIRTVEMQIRYRANDSLENWHLKAYNWTKGEYSNVGFNSTLGDAPSIEFKYYTVNLTNVWQSYVQNGVIRIKFCDNDTDTYQSLIHIDFLGVRLVIDGVRFSFENISSLTTHVVSIWVINTTLHRRYGASFFLNSGAKGNYFRADISLPSGNFTVKAMTERGNTALLKSD